MPKEAFHETTGYDVEAYFLNTTETVSFQRDVRILAITEIEKGQPCLISERASGHLVFLQLEVVENVLELHELNDKGVNNV